VISNQSDFQSKGAKAGVSSFASPESAITKEVFAAKALIAHHVDSWLA
jgi:hypothetical protein